MSHGKFLQSCSRSARLVIMVMAMTQGAYSQALVAYPKTWDVFVGASDLLTFNPSAHEFGWDASVTERPYLTHPWVGGTIEASGAYSSASTSASGVTGSGTGHVYTIMGGPTFVIQNHRIQPFAHALFGATTIRTQVTVGGMGVPLSPNASNSYFGLALGGGVDVPIASICSIRGQADWLRTSMSSTETSNMLRASAGFVLRF